MVSFYRRKHDASFGVLLDIGSGSIGGSIVMLTPHETRPHILFSTREFIPRPKTNTLSSRVRTMKATLQKIGDEIVQASIPLRATYGSACTITNVVVLSTAPWSQTATQIIHFEQPEPFEITHELVDKLVRHASRKALKARRKNKEKSFEEEGMHVAERSVVDVSLNGYPCGEPYGEQALEIDVAFLQGLVSQEIIQAVEKLEERQLGTVPVRLHTSALVQYCVLRDLYPNVSNALIIDISGEATEISIMQHHVLYESHSIEYGTHHVLDDIAKSAKTVPEEAILYLRSYATNLIATKHQKILIESQKRYALAIEKALSEITTRYALPRTVYLISDHDAERYFTDVLVYALHGKGGHREKAIVPITGTDAQNLVVWGPNTTADPRLALAARFFHKLHACGEIDNLSS